MLSSTGESVVLTVLGACGKGRCGTVRVQVAAFRENQGPARERVA